jgi:hypothetical protein
LGSLRFPFELKTFSAFIFTLRQSVILDGWIHNAFWLIKIKVKFSLHHEMKMCVGVEV